MTKLPLASLAVTIIGAALILTAPAKPSGTSYIEAEREFQGFRTEAERAKVRGGLNEDVIGAFVQDHNRDRIRVPDGTWTARDKTRYQEVTMAYRQAELNATQGKRGDILRMTGYGTLGLGICGVGISAFLGRRAKTPTGYRAEVPARAG